MQGCDINGEISGGPVGFDKAIGIGLKGANSLAIATTTIRRCAIGITDQGVFNWPGGFIFSAALTFGSGPDANDLDKDFTSRFTTQLVITNIP